jgi:uncharacterized protein (UPF0303 family)
MTDVVPALAELAAEEAELQFTSFTNDDAWALGTALVEAARGLPVAVAISRNGQQLFHAALPGTSADNDDWIRRKIAVVNRFGHSTLYMRQQFLEQGTTFEEATGLDPREYAAHGGGFPILVRNVGAVGVVVVSGLPQLDDHRMVVAAIRARLA